MYDLNSIANYFMVHRHKLIHMPPISQLHHQIAGRTHVHTFGLPTDILQIQSLQGPLPSVYLSLRFVHHIGFHLHGTL